MVLGVLTQKDQLPIGGAPIIAMLKLIAAAASAQHVHCQAQPPASVHQLHAGAQFEKSYRPNDCIYTILLMLATAN